jgi:imidazolonepropionase-like amidohydrolase
LQYWPGLAQAQPTPPMMVPTPGESSVTYVLEKDRAMLQRMRKAGMRFLAGSDGNPDNPEDTPGFTLHEELAAFVQGGLTPAEALRTATLNPAAYFGATDTLGTVAVGKLADLVLLDADPLADIHNTTKIAAVVANGHYYDRTALDHLMAEVIARAKSDRGP